MNRFNELHEVGPIKACQMTAWKTRATAAA